jgi:hypothetical protein
VGRLPVCCAAANAFVVGKSGCPKCNPLLQNLDRRQRGLTLLVLLNFSVTFGLLHPFANGVFAGSCSIAWRDMARETEKIKAKLI